MKPNVYASANGQPIRVLMVRMGSWVTWVDTVAKYLAGQGFAVAALVLRAAQGWHDDTDASGGFERVDRHFPRSRLGKVADMLRAGLHLRRSLKERTFDVLYVVDSWTLPPLWVATYGRMRWRDRRLVYHTFEWLDPSVHRPSHIRLERAVCRRADLVINIDRLRGRLQQMLYRLAQCPLWIRNSLPSSYELPPRRPDLRAELLGESAPPDALAVITPSIVSAERLALEMIQAFSFLPCRYRLATIAGDGAYFERCKQAVSDLGLQDRVVFLPRMPFGRLMEYVACADIGTIFHDGRMSAGNYMANPMRLSQFAASGLPFVASNSPSLQAEVYQYGLGSCCDEMDPKAIAKAIGEIGDGVPSLHQRSKHVRHMFETELCFESRGPHLVNALRDLCKQPAATDEAGRWTASLATRGALRAGK
jgi:glycosyltransferase involved in cell wall biosynthesis